MSVSRAAQILLTAVVCALIPLVSTALADPSTPAAKTAPILRYTAYGVYFCEAAGAVDLAVYHDGTVLSTGQYGCEGGMEREHTDVLQYHFPVKRVTVIMRRLKAFGVFDTPSQGHQYPTDGLEVLLDARFEGRRSVSPAVYLPDESEPVGKAHAYLSALVHRLTGGTPYEPHGYSARVRRYNHGWRFGTPWPYAESLDLRDLVGDQRLPARFGDDLNALGDPFRYRVYQQDLEPNCTERRCKRAFSVYWRPLWPEE